MLLSGLSIPGGGVYTRGTSFLSGLTIGVLTSPEGEQALHAARQLQEFGRHAEAADALRACHALLPGDARPPTLLADSLLALGDLAAAAQAARRATLRDPASAAAWRVLGRVRGAQGLWAKATDAAAAAVRLASEDPDAWVDLATARQECGNAAGAEAALRQALTLSPGHGAALARLATLMRAQGDPADAETMLRDALAHDPACTAARVALAGALLIDGKHAEGLALLDPDLPATPAEATLRDAHQAMAALRRGDTGDAQAWLGSAAAPPGIQLAVGWSRVTIAGADRQIEQASAAALALEPLLDTASEPLDDRIATRFALARFWSQRDDTARAFRLWTGGHRLLRPLQPFSRAAFQSFVDSSITRLDDARLAGPRAANTDPAPVFIVGMPRSGTTLAEQILAGHAAIHGAGERTALNEAFNRLGGARETAGAVARVAALGAAELDAAAAGYLAELHALAPDASRVVDKMPGNFRLLGLVGLMLPGARIIHCVRDPRDVGFSIFSLRFLGYHPYAHDLADLGWYIAQHERLMRHWTAALPNPILRVHLHDWIRDLPGTLRRVLDFLDLPYDANCERFFTLQREVRTASRSQVRRPVNRLGLGRWRAYAHELAPMIAELQAGGALPGGTPTPRGGHD
jgi:Flp pilus assembly protein TadD